MKKIKRQFILFLLVLGAFLLFGCTSKKEVFKYTKEKTLDKAKQYLNDNVLYSARLPKEKLTSNKYVIREDETKKEELKVLLEKYNSDKKEESVKDIYNHIKYFKPEKGSYLFPQDVIRVGKFQNPYFKFYNLTYESDDIKLIDIGKKVKFSLVIKQGKELEKLEYYEIPKNIVDTNGNINPEKEPEPIKLELSNENIYEISHENTDIFINVKFGNKTSKHTLTLKDSKTAKENYPNFKIFSLDNNLNETPIDITKENNFIYNTQIKVKAINVPQNKTPLVYLNNVKYSFDENDDVIFFLKEDSKLDFKYTTSYNMSFENDSNDFDLEIVSGDVICKDRKIIGNPDTLFTLEISLKDYYEIKDFKEENVQKDPLASEKLVKISENLKLLGSENKEIDLLESEYKLEDITLEDLPIEKQKIKRKYRITLKLIDNIKLKANLEKITFKVELKPYKYNNNQNTKDLLTNTDKYFNTSFAIKDFANIPAGTKITFTFKDVKDSQIRKLLLNGSTVDIKDNKYTLEVNDNVIIEYGILETYKVSIKEKTQEKYFNFVDNIKEPILEGTDVTFSLKEITNDKISKILINGNDGKVEYNEKTKQYHFKINENSEIEIVLK